MNSHLTPSVRILFASLAVVATGAAVTGVGATAQAAPAPTCDGRTATIVGSSGDDTLTGTDGDDVIWAGPGNDVVRAGKGDDLICGNRGADVLVGGAGNDRIFGLQDAVAFDRGGSYLVGDELHGGTGDDYLDVGVDDGQVEQNDAPPDPVSYSGSTTAVDVDLSQGTASGEGTDTIVPRAALALVGSNHDDTLTGSNARDFIQGGAGDDTISGLGGDDALYPELDSPDAQPNDDDTVSGGDGDDAIYSSSGHDVQRGGAGDDVLDVYTATAEQYGGAGDDTLYLALVRSGGFLADGGDDDDQLVTARSDVSPGSSPADTDVVPHASLDLSAGSLTIDWPDDEPATGQVLAVEHVALDPLVRWSVIGSQGDDDIDGTGFYGLHASMRMGDDTVHGSSAADDVNSGPGDDTVYGGDGDDVCTNTEHRFSCNAS